jgi:Uma2 family endonuclease
MGDVTVPFTRADYERLPEGFPAQLVEGELVRDPAPTYGHQWTILALLHLVEHLVRPGLVVLPPIDVGIDNENVYQPDLVVLRQRPPPDVHDVGIPWIAFEVLSPSTSRRDRRVKTPRLVAAGVAEVWLVDLDSPSVEVHDAHGVRTARGDESIASHVLPGLSIVPSALLPPR